MKKGFMLLETIVVIAVLCTILMALYIAYNNTINSVKSQLRYDNTEYVYKTYILSEFLGEKIINEGSYTCANCESIYTFCNDVVKKCSDLPDSNDDERYLNQLIARMKVKAIYITQWDTTNFINNSQIMNIFEITTQRYIRALNPVKKDNKTYRIIVMFEDENDGTIEYSSLEFKSKIRSVTS